MLRISRSHILPIGVDVGHDSVKLLQLEVIEDQLSVVAAARQAWPDEVRSEPAEVRTALAVDMIRRMLRSAEFAGRHIVAALPRDIVHVKNLRLPHMPVAELPAAVEFEARNVFSFDTEQAQVRFLHAGEVRQGSDVRQEAIVLAARNEDVADFVEQLHRAGVTIESLDFEPAAIHRSVERFIRRREDENEVNVLVDVGARRTQVIIGRGRDISFFKPIEIGGQHLNNEVSQKLGITFEEARALRRRLIDSDANDSAEQKAGHDAVRQAVYDSTRSIIENLGREIGLCLRYYSVTFRGQRPTRVRLLGGEACDPHLREILNASLPLPAEALRPLASVNTNRMRHSERRGCLCEWAAALGLSLKTTRQRFGAADGKRRQPQSLLTASTIAHEARGGAEVIDLGHAVANAGTHDAAHPREARDAQEARHA